MFSCLQASLSAPGQMLVETVNGSNQGECSMFPSANYDDSMHTFAYISLSNIPSE